VHVRYGKKKNGNECDGQPEKNAPIFVHFLYLKKLDFALLMNTAFLQRIYFLPLTFLVQEMKRGRETGIVENVHLFFSEVVDPIIDEDSITKKRSTVSRE